MKKAPEGDGKKYYAVGCYSGKDWNYIHEVLMKDGTLEDNIPCGCIECSDLKEHSATRAVYLLTDAEADELRQHPKVKYVHYDTSAYPDEFLPPIQLIRELRYPDREKQYREIVNSLPVTAGADDINRAGYQLTRCVQKQDPWKGQSPRSVHTDRVEHYGTGRNIDIVIVDDGVWSGHQEFSNATGDGPQDYVGGNVLPGNGTSDVLDLILDGPYYIDPDWFDADPGTRLIERWDGTDVPVETVARDWWGNSTQRSAKFASIGTVIIPATYTRAANSGTNTAIPTNGSAVSHATPCGALCYGRTQGWAYNANKWSLAVSIGILTGVTQEQSIDIVKLFHQHKPTNNPTISSNSWTNGILYNPATLPGSPASAVHNFRGGGNQTFTNGNQPEFMQLFNFDVGIGNTSIGSFEYVDNALTTAGDELIAAGVIFICAAGNSSQKLVLDGHPDYDNYWGATGATLNTQVNIDGLNVYLTTNRPGFPAHIGKFTSGAQVTYPAIIVGALDDNDNTVGPSGLEQKVGYSNRGNAIDCYAPADGVLCAGTGAQATITRGDSYTGLGVGLGNDRIFTGTSAACPVAAGLIATKLEYNRNWGWQDVRNWIKGTNQPTGITTVGHQVAADFFFGTESTTATDANWLVYNSLEGGDPIVIWDAPTGSEPKTIGLTFKNE